MSWYIYEIYNGLRKSIPRLLISILGLGFSIAISIFIYKHISSELNTNRSFPEYKQIRRISLNQENMTAKLPGKVSDLISGRIAGLESCIRVEKSMNDHIIMAENEPIRVSSLMMVDSVFFDAFSIPFVYGSPKGSLNRDNIVISQSLSARLFGDESPVGKTLILDLTTPLVVSGVISDPGQYTHIEGDVFLPLNYHSNDLDNWGSYNYNTFLLFSKGVSIPDCCNTINNYLKDFFDSNNVRSLSGSDFVFSDLNVCYFGPELRPNLRKGNLLQIIILAGVSILLLFLAVLNYWSLSISMALSNIRAYIIRRVHGASRLNIIIQITGEALIIVYASLLLGLLLYVLLRPMLCNIFGLNHSSISNISSGTFFLLAGLLTVLGLVSGLFPALRILMHSTTSNISNKIATNPGRKLTGRIGLWLQLTVSISIVGIIVILYLQLRFIDNSDLGFDKEKLLFISNNKQIDKHSDTFRAELMKIPGVAEVSFSSGSYKHYNMVNTFDYQGKEVRLNMEGGDENYIPALGLSLISGRNLSGPSDFNNIIINETACREYFGSDPEGIALEGLRGAMIIGVVKDYKFQTLDNRIEPLGIWYRNFSKELINIRSDNRSWAELIPELKSVWQTFCPGYPFDYEFVEEYIASKYSTQRSTARLLVLVAVLVLCISALGIYSMSSFFIVRRAREVGIRKVNGASSYVILAGLSKEINMLILYALVPSGIIIIYFIKWIFSFYEYHINPSIWVIPLSVSVVWTIALLSAAGNILRTCAVNPARILGSSD